VLSPTILFPVFPHAEWGSLGESLSVAVWTQLHNTEVEQVPEGPSKQVGM
jgi:hypothetical protein